GGTLPLFDFGGLMVRAEGGDGGALLYHFYGRQFPLDDRRAAVIEDLPKDGAFGEVGRLWVFGPTGWREWRPAALGADERDLLARVGDSVRLQVLHSVDYRKALNNPGSPDERRHGRDLSRAIAHDVPVARDLAGNLLDTVDRLASARDPSAAPVPGNGPVAAATDAPPSAPALPAVGSPAGPSPVAGPPGITSAPGSPSSPSPPPKHALP
ncbi:MAG TPA: hypothetical protein VKZ18_03410, partial [Polyangia bacterium]|nr:hypothetical protein [Polyangia bacterium]